MKLNMKSGILIGLTLLVSQTLYGETLTIKRTVELAQQNDPQWAAVKNQYLSNQQVIDQGRAGILPQINLDGSVSHNNDDYEKLGEDSYETHSYSASIVQPLFRLNNWHTYKQGKALDSQFEAEFKQNEEAFYLRIITLYLDVLRANANLSFRKAEQEAIARQLEQSKQRFEVGLVAITDVHETQAAYDTAVSTRIVAESEQFVALRFLETLTGTEVDGVVDLHEDLPILPPDPIDLKQWIDMSLQGNYGLQAAIFAANAAEQDYKSKRGDHAPTLDLVGSHSYNSTEAEYSITSGDLTRNTISLQLNLPLYSGGAVSANRRQSQYLFLAQKDTEHFTRREVIQDATNFYQLMLANVAQVNARKQSKLSAKVALEATEAGYEAGTRTIVDVLNVQRNLFQNERDYINARFDYVITALNLKQAAGLLTEEDILSLEQWMKP